MYRAQIILPCLMILVQCNLANPMYNFLSYFRDEKQIKMDQWTDKFPCVDDERVRGCSKILLSKRMDQGRLEQYGNTSECEV
jgi:hypothetical protein